jgi:DNA-binding NarL/FixJ family response regulator
MIAAGRSVSEITESLFLSVTTVSTYKSRIMAKMNLKTMQNTLYSMEHKLL